MNRSPTLVSLRRLVVRTRIAVILVLCCGVLFTASVIRRQDQSMREDHVSRVQLLARAVNVELIRDLTGTAADLDKPSYLRLKAELDDVKHVDGRCRFIYLLDLKPMPASEAPDGQQGHSQLVFLVDNEPADSEDCSPAGQAYSEAPDSFRNVFNTRKPFVEGPYEDRWGVWVTALTPVFDECGQEVVSVLAMDIAAGDWKRTLVWAAARPVCLTAVMVAIVLVGSRLLARRRCGAACPPAENVSWSPPSSQASASSSRCASRASCTSRPTRTATTCSGTSPPARHASSPTNCTISATGNSKASPASTRAATISTRPSSRATPTT